MSWIGGIRVWGRMVKFSHSVFALPFALSGAVLAAREAAIRTEHVLWIVVAMIAARNAAMGFNRLVDQDLDRQNPRTADRELPAGRLSRRAVWVATALLSALFVVASFRLHPLCGWLSPIALAIVLGYSYTKRFTWASHLVLGLGLAMAPVGGWLAVTGRISPLACLLGFSVLLWVAGFDVIYACQDAEIDRWLGLRSIPARFGVPRALALARALHLAALGGLAGVGVLARLHPIYWAGWVLIGVVLVHEHRLVRAHDLSRLSVAFFNMNGIVSVLYLVTVVAAALLAP